ncbi:HK97 gp10 family phage protein [Streptomyces triticagri]|uniref:HK97 gp10 family phage protein n=1 Tax=Streptomyces triticagri TaxID=2293568 RepID=A0A372LZ14_9ACTN|nr:HK97 gp10 family phage protein [Streptomyces triticagri]RFU83610.1 HK97 gp10 family phage protein [Streptomyces triticagri]
MPTRVNIRLNQAAINRLLSPQGDIGERVERVTRAVANRARQRAPVDSGHLRASIRSAVRQEGGRIVGRVWTDVDYASIVHNGRGPVVPRRAKALRFQIGGRTIFARRVGPARGQPFLWEALRAESPWPVRRR